MKNNDINIKNDFIRLKVKCEYIQHYIIKEEKNIGINTTGRTESLIMFHKNSDFNFLSNKKTIEIIDFFSGRLIKMHFDSEYNNKDKKEFDRIKNLIYKELNIQEN